MNAKTPGGRSLRRAMMAGAVAFGLLTTLSMLGVVVLSRTIRRNLDATTSQLIIEQQIADQIVSSAYSQQLIAYRYIESPNAALLAAFRERGDQAYRRIREYLFLEMPVSARLKVEAIKEAHQNYEVAAERAFDLAMNGQEREARARAGSLSAHADTLEQAVRSFIADRAAERQTIRDREDAALDRLQAGATIVGIGLALIAIVLVRLLLRRVMLPIEDLSAAVGQLGREPGRVRVAPQRYIEFQRLATSFDNMAERIQESRDEITRRNTELTAAIDDLRRAQLQLVQHEKLSAMGEMLAGLAHELNNPLAGILGLGECLKAELLASDHSQPRELTQEMLEPLVQETLRARDLVRNLLQFARAPAPQPEAVRLDEPIDVALGLRRHAFTQAALAIETDVPPDLYVLAQPQKLEHVFINIMNNSLDAMRGGKGTRLTIRAHADGDDVVLEFTDDGPGFEQPDRVFDPFYTTKRVGEGTGLGLSLVHRFVEEVGGTIVADNLPSGGARLTLRFVSASAPSATAGLARTTPAASQAPPQAPVAADARQRVLLVDDEPALREVQRRLLKRLSLEVESVASVAEACAAIQARRFDLVVTDLRMPGTMTGRDLIDWLGREAPALARNVVIVTGDLSAVQPEGDLPVPPERVLCKPFGRAEYIDVVTRALAAAHAGSQPAVAHDSAA